MSKISNLTATLPTLVVTLSILGAFAFNPAHATVIETGTFTGVVSGGTDTLFGGATIGGLVYGTMSINSYGGGSYGYGSASMSSASIAVTYTVNNETITQAGGGFDYYRASPCCDTIAADYKFTGSTITLSNFDIPGTMDLYKTFSTTTGTINISGLTVTITAFELGGTAIPAPVATAVPEPASMALLGSGLLGLGLLKRRQQAAATAC